MVQESEKVLGQEMAQETSEVLEQAAQRTLAKALELQRARLQAEE